MSVFQAAFILLTTIVSVSTVLAQAELETLPAPSVKSQTKEQWKQPGESTEVLTPKEWQQLDESVDRAFKWLLTQQRPNGSFDTKPNKPLGQPGVTSLCVLSFLAHGHVPNEGRYGKQLRRAIDYIVSCQQPNGLLVLIGPSGKLGPRGSTSLPKAVGVSTAYNHAIASLTLSEVYGMTSVEHATELKPIIEASLKTTLLMQRWPKDREIDKGGWRYVQSYSDVNSDLSLTGWYLMALRSAKNAGFEIPQEPVDDAIGYVRRCFNPESGVFEYTIKEGDKRSRGMAGAGVLALAHAGLHNTEEAQRSGDWILKNNFDNYNRVIKFARHDAKGRYQDRYHYGVFYCSQAMYQLGGRYWKDFFPGVCKTLLTNQRRDGGWEAESTGTDKAFGRTYATALVLLALGSPNQLLPVFQR